MKLIVVAMGFACACAVLADVLPDEYVPIDCLRGTGEQYIDTQYKLTSKSRVVIDFTLYDKTASSTAKSALPFGAASNNDYDYYFLYIGYTDKRWCPVVGNAWSYHSQNNPPLLGRHRYVINDGGVNELDGVRVPFSFSRDFIAPYNAYIFARNDGQTVAGVCNMSLNAFDIYEDGVLVRSFRPAKKVDGGELGLWELQTGAFHTNIGGGSFSGPLVTNNFIRVVGCPENLGTPVPNYGYVYNRTVGEPAVYRAPRAVGRSVCHGWRFTRKDGSVRSGLGESVVLEYSEDDAEGVLEWIWTSETALEDYILLDNLRGTGTQYIDTQYVPSSKTRVDIDFTLHSINAAALPYGASSDDAYHFIYINGGEKQWTVGLYQALLTFDSGNPAPLGRHKFIMNNNGECVFDGVVKRWSLPTYTCPWSAYVFARHDKNDIATRISDMELHAFDIYEDGNLVRSFSPAMRRADHVAGLYEWMTGNFHTNIGMGVFEPAGAFIRITGEPAENGVPTPSYGYATGRVEGTEYVCTAPKSCETKQGVSAKCVGWEFVRLDGTTISGRGNEARFVHTAADDGGTLTWRWEEMADKSRGPVMRSALRVAKGVYSGGALAGFPLLVRVSPQRINGFSYGHCGAAGEKVWFSDSPEGKTALPCEIDNWNRRGESTVWVRVPTFDANTILYMFWGLPPPVAPDESLWGDYAGVWHLNEFANGRFADSSGNGNSLLPKKNGQSFETDGSFARIGRSKTGAGTLKLDDYLACVSGLNGGDRGTSTLSGWFYAPSLPRMAVPSLCGLFSTIQSGDAKGWCCALEHRCQDAVFFGTVFRGLSCSIPDACSEWLHLAFVSSDTASARHDVYVNGVHVESLSGSGVLDAETGRPLEVWSEYLDELRLRSSASSPDWINAEYLQGANDGFLVYGPAERFPRGGLMISIK